MQIRPSKDQGTRIRDGGSAGQLRCGDSFVVLYPEDCTSNSGQRLTGGHAGFEVHCNLFGCWVSSILQRDCTRAILMR